jgi:hypothetical protein
MIIQKTQRKGALRFAIMTANSKEKLYYWSYLSSTTTTEKGGSLPFNLFPDNVIPLKLAGFILSGFSNVL